MKYREGIEVVVLVFTIPLVLTSESIKMKVLSTTENPTIIKLSHAIGAKLKNPPVVLLILNNISRYRITTPQYVFITTNE